MAAQLVPLVGRNPELQTLTAAADAAVGGAARVVALSGEAGVGKSRLAGETVALARARGFLTLHAAASPLHADLPYGVLVEALRPVVASADAGTRTALVDGLPDLGRLFQGLRLPDPAPLGDLSLERTRLFETVCQLVYRLTRRQPVLLVVDDLHWADRASLALLQYVVHGLANRRLLVLTTHRSANPVEALDVLMSSLRRAGLLVELDVGPLDARGATALARALLADEPPSTLTQLLVERSQGLPLFVRALVSTLVDSGRLFRSGGRWVLGQGAVDDLPPEVVGLMRSRLHVLAPADRRLFDVVAVAGGVAEHGMLGALAPGEDALLAGVSRMRRAGLVAEEIGDHGVRYRVTHPLLAEVAYDDLPAVVRRRTHAELAAVLGRLDPADAGRLAHHVREAGGEIDPGRALDVVVAALAAALEAKAGLEAADHAEAAIRLARGLGRAELLPRLREQRAEALELAGRGDAAIVAWREAAEESTTRGEPVAAARQLRRLALAEWDSGHLADSQTHLDAATAALAGLPIGPEHLTVAETRMVLLARRGLGPELRAEVEVLERMAAATGSRRTLALARMGRSDLCLQAHDHHGADQAVSEVMRLAEEEGDALMLEEAHRPAVCNALAWGDLRSARRLAEEGQRLARQIGVPAREVIGGICAAFTDFLAGDWDRATEGANELLARSHRVGTRRGAAGALCLRALVHARRGLFPEAMACLEEAGRVYGEGFAADRHVLGLGAAAEATVLLGRRDAAAALHVAESIHAGGIAVPPLCLSLVGAAQVAAGELAGARDTAAVLSTCGPGAPYPAAASSWIGGLLAARGGDGPAAAAALRSAGDGFTAVGMPYEAAIARVDLAEALATESAGRCAEAVALLADQLDVLDRMGARPAADRARQGLRRLGIRPAPPGRLPGRLSGRETEIARLVAEGLSNREIADRLFVSPRTVTTHLQHIYQRLGVTSRTGLTRYVLEQLSPAASRARDT